MSKRTSKRIETNSGGDLGQNAFAGLDSSGLPKGSIQANTSAPKAKVKRGRVEVRREKAGRGGKTVTTLKAFATHIPLSDLDALVYDLKKICACGGKHKDREIELQGDVVERVLDELEQRGFQPVKSGG